MKGPFLCLMASVLFFEPPSFDSDPQTRREELRRQMSDLDDQISPQMRLLFDERGGRVRALSLRRRERKLLAEYRELSDQLWFWNHAADLQERLIAAFSTVQPRSSAETSDAVRHEAGLLAYTAIEKTVKLQKEYGIHTFPIVHNLLIDVGLKKRGACKHWAEDLLKSFDAISHPHFTSYWGEAHPGNILEHNVAVLAPVGGFFGHGILIDPWRTAGKPFWAKVSDDSPHWRAWSGYSQRHNSPSPPLKIRGGESPLPLR